jgi:crotonobetainyl-CoA:carnitine CoA-transferase CaiB-like acyl-CoA transferase
MTAPLPLDGIKVVEIAQALAGPFAGEILAHLGADVVKVERPEGDEARGWGPPFTLGGGPTFHAVNMNKRSIVLDLKDPEAIAWLKGYIAEADVVVQNLRPGVIEELGLGAEALLALNPRLVFCSLWAFGHSGPRRLRPGYEPMVQAFAGLFSVNGGDEDPPSRFGAPVLDLGTGMWAAMGVLAALHQRARTGRGAVVDTSLFETALGWLSGHVAGYRFTGDLPSRERTGSRRLVPFQGFQTKNGTALREAGSRPRPSGVGHRPALRHQRRAARPPRRADRRDGARADPPHQGRVDRHPRGGRRAVRAHPGPPRDAR